MRLTYIIERIEKDIKINEELCEEYRKAWVEATDDVWRDCNHALLMMASGEIVALKKTLEYLKNN